MITLLLIRHATTDAVGKHLSGRTPGVFLNIEGQNQAQKLAEWLSGLPIKAIYSSPLERAIQTAEPLAKALQLTTQINEDFIELNFGDWTNAAFTDLQSNKEFQQFNSFRSVTRISGGESMLEAQTRMVKGLQKLYLQHPQQTVAVVSHSDLIKATIAYYAGIHLDLFQRLEVSPASVSVIQISAETARILLLNDTGEIPT